MLEELDEQRDVRADAENRIVAEGGERSTPRDLTRLAARDQLREQRIVVDGHLGAFGDAGIDSDAGHRRFAVEQQRAGLRQILSGWILGVHAQLDGVTALREIRPASMPAVARPRSRSARERDRRR